MEMVRHPHVTTKEPTIYRPREPFRTFSSVRRSHATHSNSQSINSRASRVVSVRVNVEIVTLPGCRHIPRWLLAS
jgi:hypothetical protein